MLRMTIDVLSLAGVVDIHVLVYALPIVNEAKLSQMPHIQNVISHVEILHNLRTDLDILRVGQYPSWM